MVSSHFTVKRMPLDTIPRNTMPLDSLPLDTMPLDTMITCTDSNIRRAITP